MAVSSIHPIISRHRSGNRVREKSFSLRRLHARRPGTGVIGSGYRLFVLSWRARGLAMWKNCLGY